MSNGYIQVNLGGKLRGIKFGMLAVENIVADGLKFTGSNSAKSAYDMVYWGLVNNCTVKNVDPDFTKEDVCDWVDELTFTDEGKQTLEVIANTFTASRALDYYKQKAEEVGEELKKKIA